MERCFQALARHALLRLCGRSRRIHSETKTSYLDGLGLHAYDVGNLEPRSVPLVMGYTLWHFVVDERTGELKRVPAVRWGAFWNGKIPMAQWAGREVRAIELALEVDRRRVQRVLRVLAHRMIVRSDGRPDVDRELRRAMEVAASAVYDRADPIRELELDANRFWIPIEAHLIRLAVVTDLPVDEIKAALVPRLA